jgi:hypothetical protein
MDRYTLVVLYNPVEGKDEEFNEWLDRDHIPELLGVEGFVSAQRFRLALAQTQPPGEIEHQYLTLYEIETDDIAALNERLIAGRRDRTVSDAVDRPNNSARFFAWIGERLPAEQPNTTK